MAAVDELNVIDFEAYRSRRQSHRNDNQPERMNTNALIGFYWLWPTLFWIPTPVYVAALAWRGDE